MKLVTLDFETYYDSEYSLSKMTTAEYVLDSRFETIGYSIKVNDGPTSWHTGDERFLQKSLGGQAWWDDAILVAHNNFFDALVLYWRFGILPKKLMCTLSMARALGVDHSAGGSLAALAKFFRALGYAMPEKGDEVVKALGKRRADFLPHELAAYGRYCIDDNEICYATFNIMAPLLPVAELEWQDIAIRMAACPALTLNRGILEADLKRVQARKAELMATLVQQLGVGSVAQLKTALGSGDKFCRVLEFFGGALPYAWFATPGFEYESDIEGHQRYAAYITSRYTRTGGVEITFDIPIKPSPTNPDKLTYAFAKTDEGMQELAESDDETLQALAAARLGTKSTIEESRLEKLIRLSYLGPFSVPVKVSGAHTHRLGGADGINVQNFPSGRVPGQSKAMRVAIEAPPGYVAVAGDSSQVEARALAYQAKQQDLLQIFQSGGDPYSIMASRIYGDDADTIKARAKTGRPEDKPYEIKRQAGKATILGAGFGMGWRKFKKAAKAQYKVSLDDTMAQRSIEVYRQTNRLIVDYWGRCNGILREMINGGSGYFGGPNGGLYFYDGTRVLFGVPTPGIRLPDGMWLNYPNLRIEQELDKATGRMKEVVVYDRRKGKATIRTYIHGAKLVENLTQAFAFAVMKWQARKIARYYPILMNVHDEWVTIVPEGEVELAKQYVTACMSRVPKWAQGLPIGCEVGANKSYGEC